MTHSLKTDHFMVGIQFLFAKWAAGIELWPLSQKPIALTT